MSLIHRCPRPAMADTSIVPIIPLHNGAGRIEQSIRSVLAQTLPPDEFVLIDDGATNYGPRVVEWLAAGHPQITLLSKTKGGQSFAQRGSFQERAISFLAQVTNGTRIISKS
jgi:hypothetical protein